MNRASDDAADLELLRTYEPVVYLTHGELFRPSAVDGYVGLSSLWLRERSGRVRRVVPRGKLDLVRLAEWCDAPAGSSLFLRFVERPLAALEYQRWRLRPDRVHFAARGRLARVPLVSRLLDSAFDLSLLLRGSVPGGTAAAADVQCRTLAAADGRSVYYGRVAREGGWIVLHYLFFYPMNNWRSGFYGTNDHEADWEQVFIYLYPNADGVPEPHWVAYASHDYQGDDLRRRWDDPLLRKEGTHPVIFAGAGSHASYFEPGEYVMAVEPRFLRPVRRTLVGLRRLWVERLGQGDAVPVQSEAARSADAEAFAEVRALVSIPFVDYARGDGLRLGPGGDAEWSPVLIGDHVPWVDRYRGLWGLDTRDPFGGERAPGGPKYNRDGSVRLSWYDPLGWAGLDKVVPPPEVLPALAARAGELECETAELERRIEQQRARARRLALDEAALRATAHFGAMHRAKLRELEDVERELRALQAQQNEAAEAREAIVAHRERVARGDSGDPRAHLRHAHRPEPPPPRQRIVEFWAAVSGALALLVVAALVTLTPPFWWWWLLVIAVAFATVEATARGRLANFLLSVVVVLAALTTLVLLWEFWRALLVIALVVFVVFMIRENLRELAGG